MLRLNQCLFCAAAFSLAAWGQTAAVEGVAENAVTGEPLPRVHVMLSNSTDSTASRYGALTAPDGKFSISGIKPGSYSVTGERVGFTTPRGVGARLSVSLKADYKASDLRLKLTPAGAIVGRVTDSAGKPIESAEVVAEGRSNPAARGQSITDAKGQFRVGGLAPGKYRVKASGRSTMHMFSERPEIRTDGTVDVLNAETYYPGVLTAKEAGLVEVRPGGESSGADIQLVRVPWVRVSGKAVGMPYGADQAYVTVSGHGGGSGNPINPDGSFELQGLGPGRYRISASWGAIDGSSVETILGRMTGTPVMEIEVAGSNIDNLVLRPVPDSNIEGYLEQALPPPVAQRTIALGDSVNAVPVGSDNTFKLEKVPAGKYAVGLSWSGEYVKSIRLGSVTTDGAMLDLSNGSGGADLSLILAAATASLSGIVHDDQDKPAAARVVLVAADENMGFAPRHATAKEDGAYSFPNLPPGSYKVLAVPEEDAEAISRYFDRAHYEDLMDTVEVGEGDKVSMNLKLRID